MGPRIAIPMPHSVDLEYAERAIRQYERAVALAGGEPVRIELHQSNQEVLHAIEDCQGILLPGSKADINPTRYHVQPSPHTAGADERREEVDNLLLDDAYRLNKSIIGICYGLQSLNVYRGGTLVQHIPDYLPEETRAKVNHEAGKNVAVAHQAATAGDSVLASIIADGQGGDTKTQVLVPVNSSHHQSADKIGKGLRIVSRCPDDGIIEALEGTSADHFVLAVQWHPERSADQDEPSRAIFRAMIDAARQWRS
jgi:putative glutamine amidotransferase